MIIGKNVKFVFFLIFLAHLIGVQEEITLYLAKQRHAGWLAATGARGFRRNFARTFQKQRLTGVRYVNIPGKRLVERIQIGSELHNGKNYFALEMSAFRRQEQLGGNMNARRALVLYGLRGIHGYRTCVVGVFMRSRQRRTLFKTVSRLCSTWLNTSSAYACAPARV